MTTNLELGHKLALERIERVKKLYKENSNEYFPIDDKTLTDSPKYKVYELLNLSRLELKQVPKEVTELNFLKGILLDDNPLESLEHLKELKI